MNILLVDHSPLYREILEQNLARFGGVRLRQVSTQEEAMAVATEGPVDFFVIAGQLQDGDGLELSRRLRQSGHAVEAPIALLSSSPTSDMARQAALAGVTELFRKHNLEELIAYMRHYVEVNQPIGCRLLYVEDSRDQRLALARQLEAWGATVDAFDTADEAWDAFLAVRYDLVLTDVVLGGHMSGSRLINRIRRLEKPRGSVPILAMTAFDNPARRLELFHLGVDDYVPKPVFLNELRARLYNQLSRKRLADRNEQLLRATSLGVLTVDEEGFVVSLDDNARAMFGRPGAGAMHLSSLLAAPEDTGAAHFIERMTGPGLRRCRETARRVEGEGFPVEVSSIEVDVVDSRRHYALLLRDLSDEMRLADYLLKARDSAEQLGRMRGSFLANMSHELRTPLNAISGMSHLLLRAETDPEKRQRIERIDAASRHLTRLISDVLDLSKIDAGKMELEQKPLSVSAVVNQVASLVREDASRKELDLRVEDETGGATLLGDEMRLSQALLNLAGNAVKFTEQGSVLLRAALDARDEERCLLRLEVVDTGVGVAPDGLGKLFQAFQQADASTTRRFGGSGLGLAIVRELARLMGGEAGVSSVEGQGSRFWFTASLRCLAPGSAVQGAAGGVSFEMLKGVLAGKRLLLAEDGLINREVVLELLNGLDLTIDVAEDGLAAVEFATRNAYDVILMDVLMPRLDGLKATRMIRGLPQGTEVPVIAMTASVFAEDRQRCAEAGMNAFIAKPIDPDLLYGELYRLVGTRVGDVVNG